MNKAKSLIGTRPRRLLLIGPSRSGRGGISTYCNSVESLLLNSEYQVVRIPTYGRNILEHLVMFLFAFFLILGYGMFPGAIAHVHVSRNGSALRKAIIAKLLQVMKIPYAVHIHTVAIPKVLGHWFSRSLQMANLVVLMGPKSLAAAEEYCPSSSLRIIVNASADYRGVSPRTHSIGAPLRVLYLGTLEERKGIKTLISARKAALGEWTLTVTGKDSSGVYQRLASGHSKIEFVGWADLAKKASLLHSHDVLVLASNPEFEGLPLCVLEGMSAGLAIVATEAGELPELVDESTVWFLPFGNAHALASALDTLALERERVLGMQISAREAWADRFTEVRLQKDLFSIYQLLEKAAHQKDEPVLE